MQNLPPTTAPQELRETWPAMRRGAMGKCPNCGEGAMFKGYLTVQQRCPSCGEAFYHHRADDGPAYLTVLIVSHLIGPLLLIIYVAYRPEPLTMLIGFAIGALILSLILLRPIKGAMVGFQWARRMHGFDSARPDLDEAHIEN